MNQTKKLVKTAVNYRPAFVVYRENEYELVPELICTKKTDADEKVEEINNREANFFRHKSKGRYKSVMISKEESENLSNSLYVLMKKRGNTVDVMGVNKRKGFLKDMRERDRKKLNTKESEKHNYKIYRVKTK